MCPDDGQQKCDLCRRVLTPEEATADSLLCSGCLKLIKDEKHLLENDVKEFRESSANRRFVIIWFCLCIIITLVGSYNLSYLILWLFDCIFGGWSDWLFGYTIECLISIVPGLLGFFIAFFVYSSKENPYLRSTKSAVVGIIVGCAAILSVHIWDFCANIR